MMICSPYLNSNEFEQYDPELDQEINYCDDVLAKIAPYSITKLQSAVQQLRVEVKEGNKKSDTEKTKKIFA